MNNLPEYLQETSYAEQIASCYAAASPNKPLLPPPELPSFWNDKDKCELIEVVNGGLDVRFVGPGRGNDKDAASVRANCPIPRGVGVYYFEVEIVSKGAEGFIGIGFCKLRVPLNRLPGWESDSWGYHGDDGHSFCCQGTGKQYGPKFTTGDIVGCAINFRTLTGFYTKNGVDLGIAFRDLPISRSDLYPSVGLRTMGEHVRVNFGQKSFVYDVEQYMREEKAKMYGLINTVPTENLFGDDDVMHVVQSLVGSYLSHNGYVETARAFAEVVKSEHEALPTGALPKEFSSKEDAAAVNRQRIWNAVVRGDIEHGIKLTNTFFPDVLTAEENMEVMFKLRCREFVKLIMAVAEATSPTVKPDEDMPDVAMGEEVDLVGSPAPADSTKLLGAVLELGKKLREWFPSPEHRDALQEIFSLIAYPDPRTEPRVASLIDPAHDAAVAEELNSAILVSSGGTKFSALERLVQSTVVKCSQLRDEGNGAVGVVNVKADFLG
ncbi:SPRY-domain-containing protein [Saitoella complicata NRRL Y-17804]|uniref:B30.2/SPRY domain-containing protein n=1 Tax=Saitoella complicata (strain BCRC 22490 / CBS 7301 / JCM 7358 / NBRC 10748 / NRRL Y-17804) TaxID=698492 RepID=A0A0E9NAH9_SAICN|nr:SPRY-domain-containing protein [Saitoella complicata NRRL Y-17804]ODQ55909.1 SPRY-domain-containing protein [Saitoella complicata NRRL Y-17804]GAO46818.1 hypothetical protein G7K_1036-t1 [Saitoella complicata NRRL Y-17804]